jgi:threonylcarbamoyladenosine tRNA methylthiotransferase MtaB
VKTVAGAGFKEIAITGVHLGSWGRDLEGGACLTTLLRALGEQPADVTFRVSSLEPMDCTRQVRDVLIRDPRFAPHFHLPLQHASNVILKAMRRPYSIEYYSELVDDVRTALPHAAIGSDMLVGFPGERDEDHAATLAWLERSPLTHLHVFPYSDRPGTAATAFANKVHGKLIRERAEAIRRVGRQLSQSFRDRMSGNVRSGLTLEDGTVVITDNYLKVRVAPGLPRNVRVRVRLLASGESMTGDVLGTID